MYLESLKRTQEEDKEEEEEEDDDEEEKEDSNKKSKSKSSKKSKNKRKKSKRSSRRQRRDLDYADNVGYDDEHLSEIERAPLPSARQGRMDASFSDSGDGDWVMVAQWNHLGDPSDV